MKNKIYTFIICLSLSSVVLAQDSVLEPEEKDSFNYNNVMIIPFNPDLYFSDADHDLAEYNRKNQHEIRKKFRMGLDFNVNARILTKYGTRSILTDTTIDAEEDLLSIYKGIRYNYTQPTSTMLVREEKKENGLIASINDKILINDNKRTRAISEARGATSYIKPVENNKYMNAFIQTPELLSYLSDKYGTDLFLFINQFEIKTKYEKCLDRTINNFKREILVHFSIYDKSGEQLYGNVVQVNFTVQTNDVNAIIRNNFPLIAESVTDNLPKQKRIN